MRGHSQAGPVLLLLFFVSSGFCDVKHVLDGSAAQQQQQTNSLTPHEINCLAHSHSQAGTLIRGPDGNYPIQQQAPQAFWWADENSPFKHAYEYFKKCSLKGNCNPNIIPSGFEVNPNGNVGVAANVGAFPKIDVQKNPFLNGQFQGVSVNSCVGSGCGAEKKQTPCKAPECSPQGVSINPFFSGKYTPGAATSFNIQPQPQMDLSKNPFFQNANSKFAATSSTGQSISADGGFLGVQPVQPFSNKKPFSTTYPGQSVNQGAQPFPISFPVSKPFAASADLSGSINANPYFKTDSSPGLSCKDAGYICVSKDVCKDGVMDESAAEGLYEIGKKEQYCDVQTQTCCKLPSSNDESTLATTSFTSFTSSAASSASSAQSTSFTSSTFSKPFNPNEIASLNSKEAVKFSGIPGFSSGSIQVISDANEPEPAVVSGKPPRAVFQGGVDYSNQRFDDDIRFASGIMGPAYLPPVPESTVTTTVRTYVPPVATNPPPPPPVSYSPTTQRPVTSTYNNNQYYRPSTSTQQTVTASREYLPPSPSTYQPPPSPSPAGTIQQYIPPKTTPQYIPPRTSSQYLPPKTTPQYIPPKTTPQYIPPSPTTPRPQYIPPSPTTPRPQYIPPVTTTPRPQYIPPRTTPHYIPPRISTTYIPPETTTQYVPPRTSPQYIPPKTSPQYIPPKTNPPEYLPPYSTPQYIPPSTTQRPQPSYTTPKYIPPPTSTPRPTQYLPPSTTPRYQPSPSSVSFTNEYLPPTTPQRTYPTPRPQPSYTTPQYLPPSTTQRTYPTPRPQPSYTTPQYIPPSYQPSPSTPQYIPPTPPPRTRPTPVVEVSRPSTPGPYNPSPTPGYNYPKPTPPFELPSPGGDNSNINNQYLIPRPKPSTPGPKDSDIIRVSVIPNIPTEDTVGQPDNPDSVRLRTSTRRPEFSQPTEGAPPSGCAAALKCVQEIYCTADGMVSQTPVVLTKEQEIARVPTTSCFDVDSGVQGVCCRDPFYKDPWPSANLVNGVDDGQYKEDDSIGQYNGDNQRLVRSGRRTASRNGSPRLQQRREIGSQNEKCGIRNYNSQPKGPGPLDVDFAEIPWQAMILRESNRSLLCGGVIIEKDVVLTSARCVHGLQTSDVLIKGGEWKLGIDEEPLPFQILKVDAIVRHPDYRPGSLANDLALLFLKEKLRLSKNVGTLCLPKPNEIPTKNCIATGWGKRILQLHAKGAIMHAIDVNIMPPNQCQDALSQKYQDSLPNYSPNTLCGFSNRDQCRVDYGSALACSAGDGRYTLSGIYSWDTGCKDPNQIGGYVAPDVEWVEYCMSKPKNELKQLDAEYNSHYLN